ncbi:type IV secretion system protein [Rhizorhapis suberifaciens]|uniref:Type IV secretion system protein VirB6 n=1 Tax=Rhizorhapis suberifaciens TaxID=13656 RepID=A0A840HXP9_9SPHN|nr:type IV secretion system protein [Rhizorhapis suberifaciens]MBB4642773.1 type IV secretion system protein VirB6 [Rhizorhapis suberifaciens]
MLDAIYTMLEGQITGTLAGKYAAVVGMVSAPLQTAMAINLVIVGFAVMRGVSNEPFGNYLGTWLKCYLVILAATSSIAADIAASAQAAPDQLASALGGGALSASFDAFVKNAVEPALTIHNSMEPWVEASTFFPVTIPNLATGLMVILIMLLAYIIAAIAMTIVLFIKFGLFVTIATMPIFVGTLIFPASSGLFFSWLGAVLNYAIQTAAVAIALLFVVALVNAIPNSVGAGDGGDTWTALAAMMLQLVAVLVGGFIIMQAQSIGSFAGGGGSSGAGFLSAIYPATLQRRIMNSSIGAPRRAAGAVGNAARWSLNRQTAARTNLASQAQASSGRTSMPGASSRPGNR